MDNYEFTIADELDKPINYIVDAVMQNIIPEARMHLLVVNPAVYLRNIEKEDNKTIYYFEAVEIV